MLPPPKAFISYSHDSSGHENRVLSLSERLRKDGIDIALDQYLAGTPQEGWPRWMMNQLDWADFVLVVCTETYYRRFRGHEEPAVGKGADFEGQLITAELYRTRSSTKKFVPIIFAPADEEFIPEPLSVLTHYQMVSDEKYENLYRFLTGQAGIRPAELGPLRVLAQPAAELLRVAVHNLPFASNPLFRGREEELTILGEKFQRTEQQTELLPVVVYGLGGVGKTQLAVEYAWKNRSRYQAVLWARADSPEALADGLAALLSSLDIPGVSEKEKAPQVSAVLRWLREHQRWLLIADNVDTDAAIQAVRDQFTPSLCGDLLITSRDNHWPVTIKDLDLKCLLPEAASGFLLERVAQAGYEAGDKTSAQTLAHALGYLPLALEQAAALIIELRWGFTRYLEQLHVARSELLSQQSEGATRYPDPVTTTWRITINRLSTLSRAMLRIAAWFAPDEIPRSIFSTEQPVLRQAAGGNVSTFDLDLAFGQLRRFSLIRLAENTFSIHRLVQAAEQDGMTAQERPSSLESALQLFNTFTPDPAEDVATRNIWIAAAPHAESLIAHSHRQIHYTNQVAIVAHSLGQVLFTRGAFQQADPLTELALTIAENLLGPNHPHVAIRLANRALVLKGLNRMADAESMVKRAIDISQQDPQTKNSTPLAVQLSNLGTLLQDMDRVADAEKLLKRALRLAEGRSPQDEALIATILDNLGTVLQQTGRVGLAEPLHKRALELKKRVLGSDHPRVAETLNNLAGLMSHTKRESEAERLYAKALGIMEANLFPDDPRIAIAINNSAELLYRTGRQDEAEPLLRRALSIDRKSLTADNPTLASHLANLAHFLRESGRREEAEPIMLEAIGILVRYQASTGHEIAHLRHIVKEYHRLLKDLGQEEPTIRDTIKELGRPLGFDMFAWAAWDLFEVKPPL
jgi:tetratricopeptide (TPR) repeat protein